MDKINETPGLDFDTAGGSENIHSDNLSIIAGSAEVDNSTPDTALVLKDREAAGRFVELLAGHPSKCLCWRMFVDDKTIKRKGAAVNLQDQLERIFDDLLKRQEDGLA